MYKANIRIPNSLITIQKRNTKLNSAEETIDWLNNNLGIYAPINSKNKERILNLANGDKISFKISNAQIKVWNT